MLGKTAKTFLSERVAVESKRLLAYEADTVNEVANRVGFGATTNFVRYFKNETGVTPQEFKEQVFEAEDYSQRLSEDSGRAF